MKWAGLSHRHCSWETMGALLRMALSFVPAAMRGPIAQAARQTALRNANGAALPKVTTSRAAGVVHLDELSVEPE